MTITVFMAVLFAAILHASWNALLKSEGDKFGSMLALVIGHLPFAVVIAFLVPLPHPDSWGLLICSALLHVGYQLFLLYAYRVGDLSEVYPIARGSAPLIVTLVSLLFLPELSILSLAGSMLIATALVVYGLAPSLTSVTSVASAGQDRRAIWLALGTGVFIAGYSLSDGFGARAAGTALGFYAWLSFGNVAIFVAFAALTQPRSLVDAFGKNFSVMVIGGTASFAAYTIVIWGFTQAPIAMVTALRETSILVALAIGVLFMGEALTRSKIFLAVAVVAGVVILRLGS